MNKETNSELLDLEATPKNSKPKLEKIKFLGMVRADYGAFDAGDVAELPADVAKALKAEGFAESYTGDSKQAKTEEEEF